MPSTKVSFSVSFLAGLLIASTTIAVAAQAEVDELKAALDQLVSPSGTARSRDTIQGAFAAAIERKLQQDKYSIIYPEALHQAWESCLKTHCAKPREPNPPTQAMLFVVELSAKSRELNRRQAKECVRSVIPLPEELKGLQRGELLGRLCALAWLRDELSRDKLPDWTEDAIAEAARDYVLAAFDGEDKDAVSEDVLAILTQSKAVKGFPESPLKGIKGVFTNVEEHLKEDAFGVNVWRTLRKRLLVEADRCPVGVARYGFKVYAKQWQKKDVADAVEFVTCLLAAHEGQYLGSALDDGLKAALPDPLQWSKDDETIPESLAVILPLLRQTVDLKAARATVAQRVTGILEARAGIKSEEQWRQEARLVLLIGVDANTGPLIARATIAHKFTQRWVDAIKSLQEASGSDRDLGCALALELACQPDPERSLDQLRSLVALVDRPTDADRERIGAAYAAVITRLIGAPSAAQAQLDGISSELDKYPVKLREKELDFLFSRSLENTDSDAADRFGQALVESNSKRGGEIAAKLAGAWLKRLKSSSAIAAPEVSKLEAGARVIERLDPSQRPKLQELLIGRLQTKRTTALEVPTEIDLARHLDVSSVRVFAALVPSTTDVSEAQVDALASMIAGASDRAWWKGAIEPIVKLAVQKKFVKPLITLQKGDTDGLASRTAAKTLQETLDGKGPQLPAISFWDELGRSGMKLDVKLNVSATVGELMDAAKAQNPDVIKVLADVRTAGSLGLSANQQIPILLVLLAAVTDSDRDGFAKVLDRYLATRESAKNTDFPPAIAGRVFVTLVDQKKWDTAKQWDGPASKSITWRREVAEHTDSLKRVLAYRSSIQRWAGRRIPMLMEKAQGSGRVTSTFDLEVLELKGYSFSAEAWQGTNKRGIVTGSAGPNGIEIVWDNGATRPEIIQCVLRETTASASGLGDIEFGPVLSKCGLLYGRCDPGRVADPAKNLIIVDTPKGTINFLSLPGLQVQPGLVSKILAGKRPFDFCIRGVTADVSEACKEHAMTLSGIVCVDDNTYNMVNGRGGWQSTFEFHADGNLSLQGQLNGNARNLRSDVKMVLPKGTRQVRFDADQPPVIMVSMILTPQ